MGSEKMEVLPREMIHYISTFFKPADTIRARQVCHEWRDSIYPVHHLYVLSAPVLVQKTVDVDRVIWSSDYSESLITGAWDGIPQDGFMVFPTYQDAFIYAHAFGRAGNDPNFNKGINGLRNGCKAQYLSDETNAPTWSRRKFVYHPVIFEVAFDNHAAVASEWHAMDIIFMGSEKDGIKSQTHKLSVGAIQGENCKSRLTVVSSKIEIGFVDNRAIKPLLLHDSNPKPTELEKAEAVSSWCLMM